MFILTFVRTFGWSLIYVLGIYPLTCRALHTRIFARRLQMSTKERSHIYTSLENSISEWITSSFHSGSSNSLTELYRLLDISVLSLANIDPLLGLLFPSPFMASLYFIFIRMFTALHCLPSLLATFSISLASF